MKVSCWLQYSWDTSHGREDFMTLKETIAERITQLCEEQSITPYALAMMCGVDKSTIYSILGNKSKSPEVATIKKLCDGLGLTLGEFFSTPEFDSLEQEIK
jgi:transcriptional regulator with XRE-family HTH domain